MASTVPLTEDGKVAARWVEEIDLAERGCAGWWKSGDVIIRRYKNEDRNGVGARATAVAFRRYSILWSNVQTIGPAIYAKTPTPVVTRRFRDEDPVGKMASEVLERALSYMLECGDFDAVMQLVRTDYLLPGRGQVWLRYVPHMSKVNPKQDITEDEGQQDSNEQEQEEVEYEEVCVDHVDWKDFLTNPAREESEVRWVARRVLMDREQLKKRFPKVGGQIPLDYKPKGETESDTLKEMKSRAQIYEIWDKVSRKAFWISKGYNAAPLDVRDDPLKLQGFFPCPSPLNATIAQGSTLPVPDYVLYQDQAEELDDLTNRISKLQESIRMIGFYDGKESVQLQRAFAPGNENKLIPIDTFDRFKEGGGVKGILEWIPVEQSAEALRVCYEARQQVINDIYQITGLSDIIRGDGDPNATATAEGIKAQWGSLRVRDRQKAVQTFARDILRIMAEIIAEHFSVETLRTMTGVKMLTADEKVQLQQMMQQIQQAQAQQPPVPIPPEMQPPQDQIELLESPTWEEVMGLLKNDALRSFRIEVETDSTIEADETAQKTAFVEFTNATTALLTAASGIVPAAPYTAPLFAEIMKEGARLFRVSRGMEDTIDKVFSQAESAPPTAPEGPPQPDPNLIEAEKVKAQTEIMKAQSEQQRTQAETQLGFAELGVKEQELQLKAAALSADPTPQGSA